MSKVGSSDLGVHLNLGQTWDKFIYYWTYRSFPWSAFLKISFSTPINILKDQILALMIESPCLKYEIANREGLFL